MKIKYLNEYAIVFFMHAQCIHLNERLVIAMCYYDMIMQHLNKLIGS